MTLALTPSKDNNIRCHRKNHKTKDCLNMSEWDIIGVIAAVGPNL